jgi:hypothetical protein
MVGMTREPRYSSRLRSWLAGYSLFICNNFSAFR